MKEYGLTVNDLKDGLSKPVKPLKALNPVVAKYRDDATGDTWSGRGRVPRWLAGKDKNDFLIK